MISAKFSMPTAFVDDFKRHSIQRLEQAFLRATDRVSRETLSQVRGEMSSAGLGRLGNALKHYSDLKKGKVFRRGGEAFSASGGVAIRTRNERTVGAIESYTEGAEIRPVRGRYLWFATEELGIKRVGRKKITPALYMSSGLASKLGPLVYINGRQPGEKLAIIRNVSTPNVGKGRPRRLPRSGKASSGRTGKDFIIAFIGITRTTRTRRVDVEAIFRANAARVGEAIFTELRKGV